MTIEINSERSRLLNLLVRSKNMSHAEAANRLEASTLSLHVSDGVGATPAGQYAVLTAILLASRCFGQVNVSGDINHELIITTLPLGRTLRDAVASLSAAFEDRPTNRTVVIGEANIAMDYPTIKVGWNGWRASTCPGHLPITIGRSDNPLAGIAAAALAVGQAFMAEIGEVTAGARRQEISLWEPDSSDLGDAGPSNYNLPTALWLIGLGNLGQAHLWCISSLAYPDRSAVTLMVQDYDKVSKENWGTSILVERGSYGMLKTKAAEDWATSAGFNVLRNDRAIDANLRRTPAEPAIAIAGLDSIAARRLLGNIGFHYIVDAGLGEATKNFRHLRVNAFGESNDLQAYFNNVPDMRQAEVEKNLRLPAYQAHRAASVDGGCGTLMLAAQPIVVPFISSVAAVLTVTQAIRIASGQAAYKSIVCDLEDVRNIRAKAGLRPVRSTVASTAVATEG